MSVQVADQTKRASGLEVSRRFTEAGADPTADVRFEKRRSVITNPDGSVVFEMNEVEVPSTWSQLATDILVSKYFRKAGVPETGTEVSAAQTVRRVAKAIRKSGEAQGGYFASAGDAQAFEDELTYMLIHQIGAFNSPVWFNCGLKEAYGIGGKAVGLWGYDPTQGEVVESPDSYTKPQVSACFIQAVDDDLMDLAAGIQREMRLFKFGSGTGSNFSQIRAEGEPLSSGGTSSGLMSFLEIFDKSAGAIKSGGTTRRAAKMVCLDVDHPDIERFVDWKAREEDKARALIKAGFPADFNGEAYRTVSGQNSNNSVRVTDDFMQAVIDDGDWKTTWRTNGQVARVFKAEHLMRKIAKAAWGCADPGMQYDTTCNRWNTVPNTDRIRATNPCVTGDTLVATADGPVRIDALLERGVEVLGADGRLHAIEPAFSTGVKPVYRLTTKAGFELTLTGDHRVLTANRGDVPACELTLDDRLVLARPPFGRTALDERLGELLGLMVGDGCISGEVGHEQAVLTLSPDEDAVARRIHERVTAYKQEHAADGRGARDFRVTHPQGTLRLATGSRCVIDPMRELATLDAGSHEKRFTDRVFGLDRASLAAVLRGLFTADGTVADYGDKTQYVALDSTSLELLRQTQQLLLAFGIKAKIYRDRRVAGQTMAVLPDGKGGAKEYPVRQIHSLRISRSSRRVFEHEIGFVPGSEKVGRLQELNRRVSSYEDRFEDTVASLEFVGEQEVFDLTEPATDHFVANGVVVHNCSEFSFIDDTACNLASVNLLKFLREDGAFDVEGYQHACRVFILAQEILVDYASYPTQRIAERSHAYRPLGLGYANLGSLLMVMGLPYDSPEARSVCGALTAIMTGSAYERSAEVAASKGPFAGFAHNREPMLRVMGMHRDAAYGIDSAGTDPALVKAARAVWDRAVETGERHGYRNAQASVLAPTGTIGLLMDCDTTGIEPDFALVKFKKLAGGGSFKIVNNSVPRALRNLGYSEGEIQDVVVYLRGTWTLDGAPHLDRETLRTKGLTDEDLARVEATLPSAYELRHAFSRHVLGDDAFERLGFADRRDDPTFCLLRALGFTETQIEEAGEVVTGRLTIEGAPHVKAEHLPVFDCANRCGKKGTRSIAPMGHVRMMGAAQPFLSGAISKTVNLPKETTVEEIEEIYIDAWRLGLKAVALYRDGSKASQVLHTTADENAEEEGEAPKPKAAAAPAAPATQPAKVSRKRLPKKRGGFTQEARVGGQKVYLRTGEYDDGKLGEVFIDMHKEGAALRSLMNCFAISVSLGLQHGVPLEEFVTAFTFTRFEPQGRVQDHPNIKFSTSVVDYVFRLLGMEYLGRTDFVHVKPADSELEEEAEAVLEEEPKADPQAGAAPAKASPTAANAQPGHNRIGGISDMAQGLMGDAPFCVECGHITVRNGSCYRCLNCGHSMGCS